MTAIVFYFQVHQPYRLNPYTTADVGTRKRYFDDDVNKEIVRRVAERCYLPMNAIVREQIEKTDGRFKCAFSLSGTVIQQLKDWAPNALDSFVGLAETGCVEFMGETSHHSLSFEIDPDEFTEQVTSHADVIEDLFGRRPTTFRNTELWIDDAVAKRVEELGFDVLLGEGADRLLYWRSPQFVYQPRVCDHLKLLLRSYVFSDDIAFRFSNREWEHYPLLADTFAGWLHSVPKQAQFLGLFMDYETFGEHQWAETGILDFMEYLPGYVLEDERFSFETPSGLAADTGPVAFLDLPDPVSWADEERDLSAWLGNDEQQTAHEALYALAPDVKTAAADRPKLLDDWRKLTTSDHVYYMSKKADTDGEVHEHFSPYEGPHEAFIRFSSALADLEARLAGTAPEPGETPKVKPTKRSVKKAAAKTTARKKAARKKTAKKARRKKATKKKTAAKKRTVKKTAKKRAAKTRARRKTARKKAAAVTRRGSTKRTTRKAKKKRSR